MGFLASRLGVDDGSDGSGRPAWLANRFADMGGGAARATQPAAQQSNPFSSMIPTAAQLGQFAPASYSQFGAVPYVQPTFMQAADPVAAQANPADQSYYLNQFESLLGSSLAPQFARAQQSTDADLAARGIFNSGAGVQAQNDLQNQELGTMAGAMQPLVSQFAGYNQDTQMANLANRQQANMAAAGYQQDANQYNAGASNTANAANAGAYGNMVANDQANYNAFLQQLMAGGQGLSSTLLGSYLSSFGPDPGVSGIASQGLANSSNAYANAMNAGMTNASNLSRIFGSAAGAFAPKPSTPLVPAGTGASNDIYSGMNMPVINP